MKRICVFAGSSPGRTTRTGEPRSRSREALAERDIELVYGGGCVGLMGVLADAMLARGGRVIGVIPHTLMVREVGHRGLTELKIVESMHERKATMARLSDGFIALPGGFGTLEEMFEILTWAQLGLHAHPCGAVERRRLLRCAARISRSRRGAGFRAPRAPRACCWSRRFAAPLLDRFEAYRAPASRNGCQRARKR